MQFIFLKIVSHDCVKRHLNETILSYCMKFIHFNVSIDMVRCFFFDSKKGKTKEKKYLEEKNNFSHETGNKYFTLRMYFLNEI